MIVKLQTGMVAKLKTWVNAPATLFLRESFKFNMQQWLTSGGTDI